jgi:hypothetical protein
VTREVALNSFLVGVEACRTLLGAHRNARLLNESNRLNPSHRGRARAAGARGGSRDHRPQPMVCGYRMAACFILLHIEYVTDVGVDSWHKVASAGSNQGYCGLVGSDVRSARVAMEQRIRIICSGITSSAGLERS